VPRSTEPQIEEICARIRALCGEHFSPEGEAELRRLARELRVAIRKHVMMARSSLQARKSAMVERDPEIDPDEMQFRSESVT